MKRSFALVPAICVFALVGCGANPKEDCKTAATINCQKMWTCSNVPVKVGENQADCESDYEALCLAGIEQSPNKDGCPEGKKYDGAKAQECNSGTQAQTCEQYTGGTQVAACDQICQ